MPGIEALAATLIILPFLTAIACYWVRVSEVRSIVVVLTGGVLIASAILLIPLTPFGFSPQPLLGIGIHTIVQVLDFLLLLVILYLGFKYRHILIIGLGLFQIIFWLYFEFFVIPDKQATSILYCDHLALVMVLIVSIVGSLICFQAIAYMKNHEAHLQLKKSRQPRFFFVMMLFLSAMNGLVLSNDMLVFYFFFELTTLCSFLLIAHDGTKEAVKNALRALWMNSLGGAAFILALVGIYQETGILELQRIMISGNSGTGVYLLCLALLCLAAFTKSAQFPFQSWLLGAMVAPTPVSALLHSSTMVKVGVYLVLRLAPAINGTFLSQCVAVFGGFTFLCAAALAVGQSNGKKVLAYSTISNLGLIFACAGLNTSQAVIAGILLIVFHAVIKALLFLCVGAIEQHIASRDIEDMRGLYADMPLTALITVMGVIMMIMPPFGILLSKWMAMEAAAGNLYVILMITMGSALTVMYWARWAGTLMSDPFAGRFKPERQPFFTWLALGALCTGAGLLSTAAPWLYEKIIPILSRGYPPPYTFHNGILQNAYGTFAVFPLSLVAALGFIVAILAVKRAAKARVVQPYLSGVQTAHSGVFTGPMNQPVKAEAKNYYLSSIFGEKKLTTWINLAAGVLLTLMIGGTL
ncbi:MAG: proton-conducting transporter membrane subunit [Deltaproteobacteria bacterium]